MTDVGIFNSLPTQDDSIAAFGMITQMANRASSGGAKYHPIGLILWQQVIGPVGDQGSLMQHRKCGP